MAFYSTGEILKWKTERMIDSLAEWKDGRLRTWLEDSFSFILK